MMGQVTKLCDLGPNDSVCSLQWTREGSYISVGTSHGQVQVCCYLPICGCGKFWLNALKVSKMLILRCGRFGMEHSARESEQWEVIKRELVSWHGTQGSYPQGAGIETSSNMIYESRATMSASSWGTNLRSAGWSGLMMIESLRLEATIIRSSWNLRLFTDT